MNQSSPGVLWVNQSMCANFGRFTPGQTYEIGVVSMKGKNRSESVNVKHTTGKGNKLKAAFKGQGHNFFKSDYRTVYKKILIMFFNNVDALCSFSPSACVDPMPVQAAIPLSLGTNSAQLYIQGPQLGLIDGVKVCVCPGVCANTCEGSCRHTCDWYPLPAGVHIITLRNLSPGSEYQLGVYSTSREQMGPPYYTHPVRTGEQ